MQLFGKSYLLRLKSNPVVRLFGAFVVLLFFGGGRDSEKYFWSLETRSYLLVLSLCV